MSSLPLRADGAATLISVRLTPKGGRDALDGISTLSDGRTVVLARVRSVPEDGAANAALVKLIAKSFEVSASQVSLVSGATSRLKSLRIERPMHEIEAHLARFFGATE